MLRCVAGVVERIVGVLVLARSAWLVHAVTDGDPCRVGAGPCGCSGEEPFGRVFGVPRYCWVSVGAVEPWATDASACGGRWVVGWVWWCALRFSTGHGVVGASGSQAQHVRGMLWES